MALETIIDSMMALEASITGIIGLHCGFKQAYARNNEEKTLVSFLSSTGLGVLVGVLDSLIRRTSLLYTPVLAATAVLSHGLGFMYQEHIHPSLTKYEHQNLQSLMNDVFEKGKQGLDTTEILKEIKYLATKIGTRLQDQNKSIIILGELSHVQTQVQQYRDFAGYETVAEPVILNGIHPTASAYCGNTHFTFTVEMDGSSGIPKVTNQEICEIPLIDVLMRRVSRRSTSIIIPLTDEMNRTSVIEQATELYSKKLLEHQKEIEESARSYLRKRGETAYENATPPTMVN
jgi:hypothetical protein